MSAPQLKYGDKLSSGLLLRRVANTHGSYNYEAHEPGKLAFRPGRNEHGVPETGISTYLAELASALDVLRGHDGYGLCEIDIAKFLVELERMRSDPKLRFREEVTVTFTPSEKDGPAHVSIDPVPGIVQKALRRIAVMAVHPGPPVAGTPAAEAFDER